MNALVLFACAAPCEKNSVLLPACLGNTPAPLSNQGIFFWRKDNIFLELDRRDCLSAVPTYNCRNVPERSCANDDVIYVVTSAN
jgi:hypothetical protein